MSTQDDVRRIALALPEAVQADEGFSFAVRNKGFAWQYMQRIGPRLPREPRPDVVAVRVSGEAEKQLLLDSEPEVFFTDDHYRGFPAVLVRLAAIEVDELAELLTDAWRVQAPKRLVAEFEKRR